MNARLSLPVYRINVIVAQVFDLRFIRTIDNPYDHRNEVEADLLSMTGEFYIVNLEGMRTVLWRSEWKLHIGVKEVKQNVTGTSQEVQEL